MPVLVKSGGIIRMAVLKSVNDVENPQDMKIKVFAGSDNTFDLYEDDGRTNSYTSGKYAITKMELNWSNNCKFTINTPEGDTSVVPESRNYEIEFVGIKNCQDITVKENGVEKSFDSLYSDGVLTVSIEKVSGKLEIQFNKTVELAENNLMESLLNIIEHLQNMPNATKDVMYNHIKSCKTTSEIVNALIQLNLDEKVLLSLCEVLNSDA
jgi:hypothetical protein